jgi:MFS family permease
MYFFTYLPIFLFNIPIGMVIDRSSVKKSLFILLFMNLFSQIVCTIMVVTRISGYIILMYIMRSIFGVAGEGIFTVQGLIITKYCKDNFEIVMSIGLSLPFIFDSLNSLVTTRVYDSTQAMIWPWSIGIIVSIISVTSGFVLYFFFIRKGEKKN